jgi:hypothetical protein
MPALESPSAPVAPDVRTERVAAPPVEPRARRPLTLARASTASHPAPAAKPAPPVTQAPTPAGTVAPAPSGSIAPTPAGTIAPTRAGTVAPPRAAQRATQPTAFSAPPARPAPRTLARQARGSASGADGPSAGGASTTGLGGGGGGDAGVIYDEVLRRVRQEQEQLGQLIPHPF